MPFPVCRLVDRFSGEFRSALDPNRVRNGQVSNSKLMLDDAQLVIPVNQFHMSGW
jgi:hypothetical protein